MAKHMVRLRTSIKSDPEDLPLSHKDCVNGVLPGSPSPKIG